MMKRDLIVEKASLLKQIYEIDAKIKGIEDDLKSQRGASLVEEVYLYLQGIDVIPSDYYAQERRYSNIVGVKNISLREKRIDLCEYQEYFYVKVTSPIGYMLPEKVKIEDKTYDIVIGKSSKFERELDY